MKVAGRVIHDIFQGTFPYAHVFVSDSLYHVPRLSLYEKAYGDTLEWLENSMGFRKWAEHIGDCDKFARFYQSRIIGQNIATSILHPDLSMASIPVAFFYYNVNAQRGRGHAINAGIYRDDSNNMNVCFIEPQPGASSDMGSKTGLIDITEEERNTAWVLVV